MREMAVVVAFLVVAGCLLVLYRLGPKGWR